MSTPERSVEIDPYRDNVVFHLDTDFSAGSLTVADISKYGNTGTFNGTGNIGTSGGQFGSGYYVGIDKTGTINFPFIDAYNFGLDSFTIEGWIWINSGSTASGIINRGAWTGSALYSAFLLYYSGTNLVFYAASEGATSWDLFSALTVKASITTNAWHHFAISRSGMRTKCYCDGVAATDGLMAYNDNHELGRHLTKGIRIGGGDSATHGLTGRIYDIKITRGIGRYPRTCPVPTAPYSITPPYGNIERYNGTLCEYDGTGYDTFIKDVDRNKNAIGTDIIFSPSPLLAITPTVRQKEMRFNGITSKLETPIKTSGIQNVSYNIWIDPVKDSLGSILSQHDGTNGIALEIVQNGINEEVKIRINGTYSSGVEIKPRYQNIILTYKPGTAKLYIEGLLVLTFSGTVTWPNEELIFGNNSLDTKPLASYIPNIKVFYKELTATECLLYARDIDHQSLPWKTLPPSNVRGDKYYDYVSSLLDFNDELVDNKNATTWATMGTATYNTTDQLFENGCYSLGLSGYIESAASTSQSLFRTHNFTIEGHFKLPNTPSGTKEYFFDSRINNGTTYIGIGLFLDVSSDVLKISIGNTDYTIGSTGVAALLWNSTYHHIAISKTNGVFKVFINGTQHGSDLSNAVDFTDTGAKFLIGTDCTLTHFLVNSTVDSFRITKSIGRYTATFTPLIQPFLNDNEVGPIAHWTMDNYDGTTLYDETSFAHNSTVKTGTITTQAGIIGNSIGATGSSGFEMGTPSTLHFPNDGTISVWIYITSLATRQLICGMGYAGEGTLVVETNGTLNFFHGNRGMDDNTSTPNSTYMQYSTASGTIVVGTWTHVTVVKDGKSGFLKIYKNGVLLSGASLVLTSGSTIDTLHILRWDDVPDSTIPFYIAKTYTGSTWSSPPSLNGQIDNLRVFDRALSQSEINFIYYNHLPVITRLKSFSSIPPSTVVPPYRGKITGTLTNEYDLPVSRQVALYDTFSNRLIKECWSKSNGYYEFLGLNTKQKYIVMARDHLGVYNAVVEDNVTPVNY